jgi:hypothetical protein
MRADFVSKLTSIVLILGAVLISGCGGGDGLERVALSGSVTLNGEPVPNGVVRFAPAAGTEGPMASAMITDGRYQVPRDVGPVAGNYEARIHAYQDPNSATKTSAAQPAIASDKLGPKISSDDPGEDDSPAAPQAPNESKRTFNVTIPELSSFEQDFAL